MGSFGFDGGFDPTGFFGGVTQFLEGILASILAALEYIWVVLVNVVEYLWAVIVFIGNFLFNLFGILGGFVKRVISDIIHGNFRDLVQAFWDLQENLRILFAPILAVIQWLRASYFQYVYPWVLRVQELLSELRGFLVVFKLLGFKWASKLDQDIQAIQATITRIQQDIIKTLNTMTSLIQLFVDPAGIFRRDFLAGTLFSSLAAVKRAVAWGAGRALTTKEQASQDGDKNLFAGGANVATRNADGSVTYSAAMQIINANGDAAAAYYGVPH